MPSSATVKTASALRLSHFIWLLLGALLLAVILASWQWRTPVQSWRLGRQVYHLEVVRTPEDQARGLGGRAALAPDHGMLFAFDRDTTLSCIWMKDMHFAIDVVWVSADRRVVALRQNVAPDTYPQQFCPPGPVRDIIELRAGQLRRAGVRLGQQLTVLQ